MIFLFLFLFFVRIWMETQLLVVQASGNVYLFVCSYSQVCECIWNMTFSFRLHLLLFVSRIVLMLFSYRDVLALCLHTFCWGLHFSQSLFAAFIVFSILFLFFCLEPTAEEEHHLPHQQWRITIQQQINFVTNLHVQTGKKSGHVFKRQGNNPLPNLILVTFWFDSRIFV